MEAIGLGAYENDQVFRWPSTIKDLFKPQQGDDTSNYGLIPKLFEIKTAGTYHEGLTSIQLCFENGLKSPNFDAVNLSSEEI